MPSPSESVLRDAAIRGDAEAWQALYAAVSVDVARYVRWRCGGRSDWAEDALQETWLTAARALPRFDPARGTFSQWIYGFAANVIRNRIRGWKRSLGKVSPLVDDVPANPAHEPDRETALLVMETLAQLPERYERALRAKYLDEWEVNEIARQWGESPKAIESLLTRARQAFRDAFPRQTVPDDGTT